MLKIRTVIVSVLLAVVLMLTVQLVNARTEVVSDPLSDAASVSMDQDQPVSQNNAPIPSYRSPLDECFDVSLRELTNCRRTRQVSAPSPYRSPLDECFDVSLKEVAGCRESSHASVP